MPAGYVRQPSVQGDTVVFVAEDDLWSVPLAGGRASRLTTGLGAAASPRLSPDGRRIAFSGTEEGVREAYLMDADGGALRRLTWFGEATSVLGFLPDGRVAVASATGRAQARDTVAWAVDPDGAPPEPLPYGPVAGLAFRADGAVALCRHQTDLAWWKGYRGGRTGAIWVQEPGGPFRRWALDHNAAAPFWVGDRLWLVADPEGTPQLYSFAADGSGRRRHTRHEDLAVRFPATDGRSVVFVHGGDLYTLDPEHPRRAPRRVEVELASQRTDRQRRFVSATKYLEDWDPHPDGHSLALTVRGRPFVAGHWEGPVRQLGARDGIRYRMARWIDAEQLLVVSDEGGEERLQILPALGGDPTGFPDLELGRPAEIEIDPTGTRAAVVDHRQVLTVLDLRTGAARVLDRAEDGRPSGLDWSADGRWLAWSRPEGPMAQRARIRICDVADGGEPFDVTDGDYRDVCPSFDPDGEHLYLLSQRTLDPISDVHAFGYAFARGYKPYLVTLRRDLPDPFRPAPRPVKPPRPSPARRASEPVRVDREGLQDRIVPFPLPEGRYEQIAGVGQGQVLLTRAPVRGTLDRNPFDAGPPKSDLQLLLWEFDKQELVELNGRVSSFRLDRKRDTVALRAGWRLRVFAAKPDKGAREEIKRTEGRAGRKGGWVDLGRVRVSVEPGAEWRQMLREAWRLMRDHYWDPALGGVDWPALWERYQPLCDRVATRGELSDLVWCLHGELGTSHAYELGGDYRVPMAVRIGRLGADHAWDGAAWVLRRVVRGEPGDPARSSPLLAPGVGLAAGDRITRVGGEPVRRWPPLEAQLAHQAGCEVELEVESRGARRRVVVHTLSDDRALRYRDWVLENRRRVHRETDGRVGYVHVPDMGPPGFAEFHRDFHAESGREALLVDVRFNRGGHVSQLLLEKLARRRLGYKVSRWGRPGPYPAGAIDGPMVCLTNEMAGSDGDIFSHAWKLLGLGPLIGTRTWGGVVGIWPRHLMVDRGVTTQPEYASWFVDVGYGLENRGTEPDEVVEITPEDHAAGRDPQLDRGLELIRLALRERPTTVPDLSRPPR